MLVKLRVISEFSIMERMCLHLLQPLMHLHPQLSTATPMIPQSQTTWLTPFHALLPRTSLWTQVPPITHSLFTNCLYSLSQGFVCVKHLTYFLWLVCLISWFFTLLFWFMSFALCILFVACLNYCLTMYFGTWIGAGLGFIYMCIRASLVFLTIG